jgi:hypothetical protein
LDKWEIFGSLQLGHVKFFVKRHKSRLIPSRDGTLAQTAMMGYRFASVPSR